MSAPRRISAVVPTLDTREMTAGCVDALLAARLPGEAELEVVVVDDGSRDGTAEELSRRPGVRVLRNEAPRGYSRAVNRGAAEASGELLLLLNSDTVVGEGSLEGLLAAFDADASLAIAGAVLTYPDGSPQWSAGREPTLAWLLAQASGIPPLLGRLPGWRRLRPLQTSAAREADWVTGAAVAVRATVWRELGPFDESYRFYAQDLDLCLRARDRGHRVRVLPELRVVHRHGATISSREGEVVGSADLGLLWGDLVRWAGKRHGERFARRARAALRAGSGLRLLLLRMARVVSTGARREALSREAAAVSRARAAIRPPGPAGPAPEGG